MILLTFDSRCYPPLLKSVDVLSSEFARQKRIFGKGLEVPSS